jgi:hypothetical protein
LTELASATTPSLAVQLASFDLVPNPEADTNPREALASREVLSIREPSYLGH